MGQTADELRRDIEVTRNDLGNTLDAIGDRVSPGRIVERRKNRVMRGFGRARDWAMGPVERAGSTASGMAHGATDAMTSAADTARHAPTAMAERTQGNPLLVGALAAGAGFFFASVLPVSRREEQIGSQVREKAQPLVDEVAEAGREAADHLKEPAREAAQELRSTAQQSGEELRSTAQDTAHEVKDSARQGR